MNDDFINLATAIKNQYLLETEVLFTTQKQKWFANFAEQFQSICTDIVKLQNESSLPAISYMEYTMLYTNFINRRYVAEIRIYGDMRYFDKNQCMIGEYDLSFLFVYFEALWEKLLATRKRYVGKVSAQKVASFMIQALPDFYSYLFIIARFAIADCIDKKPFVDIIKNKLFWINVGPYMTKNSETAFKENKNKDAETLAEWFCERLENAYAFEDYADLNFSGYTFDYTDFRYAHFRNSNLNNVVLEGSNLIGTSFYNTNMENCRLDNCYIHQTDFSYAILKNASFINARGRFGLPDDKEWQHVGFLPVSFRHADLTNVDFRGADLTGADFTGAVLDGVDFTDTILDGAIFRQ